MFSRIVVGPGTFDISEPISNTMNVPGVVGLTLTDLWRTEGIPVSNLSADDLAKVGKFQIAPDATGTCFRLITFPSQHVMEEASGQALERLGGSVNDSGDHLMWHQTNTIDYITIVTGAVDLVTEQERFTLRTGDTAVVRGIRHAFISNGAQGCLMSCVSVGAQPNS